MLSASDVHNDPRVTQTPASPAPAPYGFAGSGSLRHTCPQCRGVLVRVWRRPIDRLTSQFVPVHRFHCEGFSCGWEGNIRVDGTDSRKKSSWLERAAAVSVVALVLVTSVALAVMLVVATVGWFTAHDRERDQVGLYKHLHEVVIPTSTYRHSRTVA